MKSIYDVRRENLVNLINSEFNGVQTRLAERMGTQANLVNRWALGKKVIGDLSARKIEEAGRKPRFWMDLDSDTKDLTYQHDGAQNVGEIASVNLTRWMQESRELSSQGKVSRASGVSQATVGRVINKEASVSISTLEAIARAFGRQGYELLLHPADPSVIRYDRQKYASLPEEEKTRIENFIKFAISQHELAPRN